MDGAVVVNGLATWEGDLLWVDVQIERNDYFSVLNVVLGHARGFVCGVVVVAWVEDIPLFTILTLSYERSRLVSGFWLPVVSKLAQGNVKSELGVDGNLGTKGSLPRPFVQTTTPARQASISIYPGVSRSNSMTSKLNGQQ